MEEHWSSSNDKLVSAEEGLKPEIRKNAKQKNTYCLKQFIQIFKSILYFQLICFVVWSGYTFWQVYNRHENIHFYIFNLGSNSSSESESLKVLNESSLLPLDIVEETLETTTNIPLVSNTILSNDDQFFTTMKILDSSTDKNDISTMNTEEKAITNPFENTSTHKPIEDSTELQNDYYRNRMDDTVSSSKIMENKDKVEQALFDWYFPLFSTMFIDPKLSIDKSSKETHNSETDRVVKKYFRKVGEDQNEESDFKSEEYDLSSEKKEMEILLMQLNLFNAFLGDLSDNYSSSNSDDLIVTTESPSMDEKSEDWSSSDISENSKRDTTEASVFTSEEKSEEKSEENTKWIFPLSDITEVKDDATSELKSTFFPTLDWRMQDSSIETSKTKEESTETLNDQEIKKLFNILQLWGLMDRDSTENVDSEKEIEDGERQENSCIEDIINGIKVLKCYSTLSQVTNEERDLDTSKESNDRSSSIQSSHSFTEEVDENVDTNYGITNQEPIEESTDFSNSEFGKSDISTEWGTKKNPSTNVYFEENPYQDTEDPIRWWLDLSKYHENEPVFGDEILEEKSQIPNSMGQKTFFNDEDSNGKRRRRMTTNDKTLTDDWMQTFQTRMIKNKMREYSMIKLNEKLTRFYSNMDIASSHIDALHELYLRERKLEDDYVSKEFSHETLEIVN